MPATCNWTWYTTARRSRKGTDVKTQRIAENFYSLDNAAAPQKVAKADYSRIALLFLPATGGTAIYVSTKSSAVQTNMLQLFGGNQGPAEWRLYAWRERELCCTEWYGRTTGVLGVNLIVLEVFEQETPEPRSDGGIILGQSQPWRNDAMQQIQSDTASMLLNSINAAARGARYAN